MAALLRRRALLGACNREEPDDSMFFIDFSAGASPNLAKHPRIVFCNNPVFLPDPPELTPVVKEGLSCIQPAPGTYIAVAAPCCGSEAVELDCFTPAANSPVVSCGNGLDDFAPAQFVHEILGGKSYLRVFTAPTVAENVLYLTAPLQSPMRKRLRIERRGTDIRYYMNEGDDVNAMSLIRQSNVVGTAAPLLFQGQMVGLGYRTGFVFPSGTAQVVSIKWEKL